MVTISDCTSCHGEFPAEDLCSDGLCVECYDKVPGDRPSRQPYHIPQSDEEQKRRRKERKRTYQINNNTKIATYERERRARLRAL